MRGTAGPIVPPRDGVNAVAHSVLRLFPHNILRFRTGASQGIAYDRDMQGAGVRIIEDVVFPTSCVFARRFFTVWYGCQYVGVRRATHTMQDSQESHHILYSRSCLPRYTGPNDRLLGRCVHAVESECFNPR